MKTPPVTSSRPEFTLVMILRWAKIYATHTNLPASSFDNIKRPKHQICIKQDASKSNRRPIVRRVGYTLYTNIYVLFLH